MDNYLDSFLILALDARYTDPQTLVVKFHRRLKLNVQSQIATIPFGRPVDTDLEAWYAAARRIDQVQLANKVFQSTLWSMTMTSACSTVTNFIRPYLHQFFIDFHGLNGYGKPLKRPFDRYQSHLEAISNGRDIRQINW